MPATRNHLRHVVKHVWMSRSARRFANGCGRLRNVERTHPQPHHHDETGALALHSGKNIVNSVVLPFQTQKSSKLAALCFLLSNSGEFKIKRKQTHNLFDDFLLLKWENLGPANLTKIYKNKTIFRNSVIIRHLGCHFGVALSL